MSDFEFNTFPELLACEDAWQVVQGEVFSVNNMDDRELRESIVDDLLSVTFWEIQHNEKVFFDMNALMRFVTGSMRARVLNQLTHPEITGLIEITANTYNIRIITDRAILQAAQDYAGVWYGDFEPTDKNTTVLTVNSGILADAVKAYGSIDALTTSLAMDLVSDAPVNQLHSKPVNQPVSTCIADHAKFIDEQINKALAKNIDAGMARALEHHAKKLAFKVVGEYAAKQD